MMPDSFFSPPRRRTVIFVAVIGALHYVALAWLTSHARMVPLGQDHAQMVGMALIAEPLRPLPVLPPPPPPAPTELASSEPPQWTATASDVPEGPATTEPAAVAARQPLRPARSWPG